MKFYFVAPLKKKMIFKHRLHIFFAHSIFDVTTFCYCSLSLEEISSRMQVCRGLCSLVMVCAICWFGVLFLMLL